MSATTQKKSFEMPYAGITSDIPGGILYGKRGDFSMIFRLQNPVLQYGADGAPYEYYHQVLLHIVKILGEGYSIQKQDVFYQYQYQPPPATELLQQKFHAHFQGRPCKQIVTYLVITRLVKKHAFYTYDRKALQDFREDRHKILELLQGAGTQPQLLTEPEIHRYVTRILTMDFASSAPCLHNISSGARQLEIGAKTVRNISLVNTDAVDLPEKIGTYTESHDAEILRSFPTDNLAFLHAVPDYQTIIYNQVLEIPAQQHTLNKLELKRKRHSGVPDPANQLCVADIDQLLADVARENQLLVHSHFNIVICADPDKISKASNFIEAALFQRGIIASSNAYNQLELFRTVLPGNTAELKNYDWFLTTVDAALCLFFKESLLRDEQSDFQVRFTDRQGIPVVIDPADLPMRTGRINNRNKFVLGGSGSGKSFFMNALVEQYLLYPMDIVIVDTGHSYSGLCSYRNGKYMTYSEQHPITMNPFQLREEEYNIEKKDFLCTLVSLLWKGAEGSVSSIERDVISQVISAYYAEHFQKQPDSATRLDFNGFYEFALQKIPQIKTQERISFDLDEFRYVLKKFYEGGEFASILNESADTSLFDEPFIVFEIDAVKEHKILFPIVTLIIMDVFIQKMRHRTARRKCLIVEEAWKAIASPLMAGYLLYLYKTVRKFWGEAIVVTQELADILGNTVVKDSILSNSDTTCLLDQSRFRENYEDIARLLSLSATEQKKIFTINQLENKDGRGKFKEVYIRRGTYGEVYGVEVSLHQYLTYTTEKPEKTAVESYALVYGNFPAGLDAFVNDLQDSKLPLESFVDLINAKGPLPFTGQFKPC
jgi:conjugation system TraG family ATPase